jgi:hypothetical protein
VPEARRTVTRYVDDPLIVEQEPDQAESSRRNDMGHPLQVCSLRHDGKKLHGRPDNRSCHRRPWL